MLAVGAVVKAKTGLVLDYKAISEFCEQCTKKDNAKKAKKNQTMNTTSGKMNTMTYAGKTTVEVLGVWRRLQQ